MASSQTIIDLMTENCRRAWDSYEAQYSGGMGGGRHTAVVAFKAAWEAAFDHIIGTLK